MDSNTSQKVISTLLDEVDRLNAALASQVQVTLPGKLGNPKMQLKDDPRCDPRIVAAMAPFKMDVDFPPIPLTRANSLAEKRAFCDAAEVGHQDVLGKFYTEMCPLPCKVERSTEVVKGSDGNVIYLYIHKPAGALGPMPGILHCHGGGMAILKASDKYYMNWRDSLAATGMVVVGVEFRNAAGALGPHPYPAGLNDCYSALEWFYSNKSKLGVSKIITSGESGGGNLSLAITMKAKKEGKLDYIQGTYSQCPYIAGPTHYEKRTFTSMTENQGFFLDMDTLAVLSDCYVVDGNEADPLAWPSYSTVEDLKGLPPTCISVNELDPLRDEGLQHYQKLMAAGVNVYSRTVNGTVHAADLIFGINCPEIFQATIRDIRSFAENV